MALAHLQHADAYYVKNGKPTTEPVNLRLAIRTLRKLYGHIPARDLGPLALKTVRQAMIDGGLCRNEVNKRIHLLRRLQGGRRRGDGPPSVHHGLQAVHGLRRGRADVRESAPVKPVPEATVAAIRRYVPRQVCAMIELQRLSGMRPGEVVSMRSVDLDTIGRVWS
jgi:integrase